MAAIIQPGVGAHQIGIQAPPTSISQAELVKLGAVDTELFARSFFPTTFRNPSPKFGKEIWDVLDDPRVRLANIIAFRGSSKTTRLRVFCAKRIAYGISRTIVYIGASETKAVESVNWIRNRIDRNVNFRTTFGLKRGQKWEETQIEIEHETFGHTIRVMGFGITGSIRGINIDDHRPDLIIVDDPQTDETAATEGAREKLDDLILGAVKNSLAPIIDEPNAKMVMNITPQHPDDVSQKALRDPQWTSRVYPCWTKETMDLEVDSQESSWPERFPTKGLREDKKAALQRNKLSLFTREMECRLTSKESSSFLIPWLNVRATSNSAPRGRYAILAIDPVPPPSPRQMARNLQGKDFEAHYVWCRDGGDYHLCDFARSRGHDPSWTTATALTLARKWRVSRIVIDAVAYQRSLKWILEQAMQRTRTYYQVIPIADGMKKFARITNVFGGLGSDGRIFIGPEHTIFASQFERYGPTYNDIDDDIDASALAVQELSNPYLERVDDKGQPVEDDSDVEDFRYQGASP